MIVGGGPSGAATALFLCAAEPRIAEHIVLFDKATFPRDKICAGAVGGRGDALLRSIGVDIDVDAAVVNGLHVRASGGELLARHPRPIGRVVRRRAYDAKLLDAVRERGVDVRDGVAVTAIRRNARSVVVDTEEGEVSAQAVVGADGVGSRVRRSLGWPQGRYYAQAIEVDTERIATDPPADVLSFDICKPFAGYAWDFPTRVGGRSLVCRGIYALTRGVGPRTVDVGQELTQRLERLGVCASGPFKRFAERGLSLYEPLAADRVLLVGEAAGIDPVLGEGIPQAILYGKTVGSYLAECWRQEDFRFTDYRRVMRKARIGFDLRVRAPAAHLIYGPMRPSMERWITSSRALAHAGMHYFAGEHVPRARLLRAVLDFPLSQLGPSVVAWR